MKFSNDSGEIASIIKSGGIALIQTDTVFGLLCLGTEVKAIEKIKAIKHRTKPSFSFFVRDTETAKQYAVLSDIQQYCFNVIFPGHFTLILEATEKTVNLIPNSTLATADNNGKQIKTIGIRIPNSDFCRNILTWFDIPLLATSANISGQQTPINFKEIEQNIINAVDVVYYSDKENNTGVSSTIVDIIDIQNIKIVREGSGNIQELLQAIKQYKEKTVNTSISKY